MGSSYEDMAAIIHFWFDLNLVEIKYSRREASIFFVIIKEDKFYGELKITVLVSRHPKKEN